MENENALSMLYNKEFSVVVANDLIRSKQPDLTLLEVKIIRLVISQILQSDTDLRTYTCKAVDLAKYLGIDKDNVYKEMNEITTNLMTKIIILKDTETAENKRQPNYKKFPWADYAEYNNGILTLRLSDKLKPYLTGLNELFTKYEYSEIIKLPTTYSIRLYELLQSFQPIIIKRMNDKNYSYITDVKCEMHEIALSIDYLREYFNCKDKYPNNNDFIKRIIEPSLKAFDKLSTISVEFRKVKQGRSITHIVFGFTRYKNYDEDRYFRVNEITERLYGAKE